LIRNKINESSTKTNNSENLQKITDILGLMEEKDRGKNWLIKEFRQNRKPLKVSPSSTSVEILKSCTQDFILKLYEDLTSHDFSVPEVKTSETYHWFFTDIVGSSIPKIETTSQVEKILQLTEQIKRTQTFKESNPQHTVIIPTGDGMAIGFSDTPEKPLKLAKELHKALNTYNQGKPSKFQIKIRIGIDSGPVYAIKDLNHNDTVWGPGIIMARRVMDLCDSMHILASDRIAEDISNLSPEYKSTMHKVGNYSIKHGNKITIYNIYGERFGNKNSPKKGKYVNQSVEELIDKGNYVYNSIDVKLDVTDPKTMMTHHTWIWDIKNKSNIPIEQIAYFIEGDCPREWDALNLKIQDRKKNQLLITLDENESMKKTFKANLVKPLLPNKTQKLTLEFDWEEPKRKFSHVAAHECKKFSYRFTIPHGEEIKNRMFKVNPVTKEKIYAKPTPQTKSIKDITEITWKKESLKQYEDYEFPW